MLLKFLPKSSLNRTTAPAHLYATDAIVYTALFSCATLKDALSFNSQLHVLFDHTPVAIKINGGTGLGIFNEAASESVHRDFLTKWPDFAIANPSNPLYGPRLLRAVQAYNSQHI